MKCHQHHSRGKREAQGQERAGVGWSFGDRTALRDWELSPLPCHRNLVNLPQPVVLPCRSTPTAASVDARQTPFTEGLPKALAITPEVVVTTSQPAMIQTLYGGYSTSQVLLYSLLPGEMESCSHGYGSRTGMLQALADCASTSSTASVAPPQLAACR